MRELGSGRRSGDPSVVSHTATTMRVTGMIRVRAAFVTVVDLCAGQQTSLGLRV